MVGWLGGWVVGWLDGWRVGGFGVVMRFEHSCFRVIYGSGHFFCVF